MAMSAEELVQRGHNFAIVDEVDSILIDEARTPLIISGPAEQSARWYQSSPRSSPAWSVAPRRAARATTRSTSPSGRSPITERGVARVEDRLGVENLYESANTPLVGYLNNALKAKELYKRDKDYIVTDDDEVLIVDEFTGRILHGRRYNEGMHQAIEAKEGVEIKQENQTLATITLQNYFRLYEKLSGMTGTAQTEAAEFNKVYNVGVVTHPDEPADGPRRPVRRDLQDREGEVQRGRRGHRRAARASASRSSSARSRWRTPRCCRQMLRRRGIAHSVLNAKYHAREAEIVAQAGRKGAVTVATNMAGRGTDIVLGGNPEFLAAAELRQRGLDPEEPPEEYSAAWDDALQRWTKLCDDEGEEVVDAGGLYVLGTERHESRRIDNQLRGRSGRQGDPGESRFYLSLQDELMQPIPGRCGRGRHGAAATSRTTCRSRSRWSAARSRARRPRSRARTPRSARTSSSTTRCSTGSVTVIYTERKRVLDGEDLSDQVSQHARRRHQRVRQGRDRRGVRRGLGPRAALDQPQAALPGRLHHRGPRGGGRRRRAT